MQELINQLIHSEIERGNGGLLAFILIIFVLAAIHIIASAILNLMRMLLRVITILAKGYPPEHCDVDGEAVESDNC